MHESTYTIHTCGDAGIFVRGGPGQSDKKKSSDVFLFVYFLVLSLFYRSQMVNLKKSIIFQGSRGGPTFSRGGGGGGGPTFSKGSNCLFPIETNITCDFPGGANPLSPPLDPHLTYNFHMHFLKYSVNVLLTIITSMCKDGCHRSSK